MEVIMSMPSARITDEQFVEEGLRIIREGESQDLILRLLGSVAIRLHSPRSRELYEAANRPLTDLDFMSYRSCNARMPAFFESMGYEPDSAVLRHFGQHRHVYWNKTVPGLHCDVFFDRLSFCHEIDFQGRLDQGVTTIRPTELLLEKMQIVEINEKDLKDSAVLLREHEVNGNDPDTIDGSYVAELLSKDWGFWYTLTTNLQKLTTYVADFDAFAEQDREIVVGRVDELMQRIEEKPKTTSWKLRAKVGTRKKWYRQVEEVEL
jgi:hypothetical protein